MRSNPRLFNFNMKLRDGDRVFYEPVLDVVAPNGGWVATNDADLLYPAGRLSVGVRYTATGSIYQPEHYPAGETDLGLNPTIHRVGPIISYTFYDEPDRLFNAPSVVLISQWFLSHRYRTGAEVSRPSRGSRSASSSRASPESRGACYSTNSSRARCTSGRGRCE
ncbi:hypothetical protein ACN28S_31650 [Cystobacter fuscus]